MRSLPRSSSPVISSAPGRTSPPASLPAGLSRAMPCARWTRLASSRSAWARVAGPRRNVTATPKLAVHILDIHTKLTDLIELRDAGAARALMDDHVKMIRARRVAEREQPDGNDYTCC